MPLAAAADAVWVHSLWQLPRPPRVTLPNPQAIGQLATEGESERASERELNAINLYFIIYCAHIALRSPASASSSSLWAKMF